MIPLARTLAAILLCAMPAAAAAEAPGEPVKLVRTLQLLQDQIAHGVWHADGAQRALLDLIAERFLAADAKTWDEPANANAALLYVLSGGNPAVLDRLPASADAERSRFIAAVRAYAMEPPDEATAAWSGIALDALPRALVAPAALVKATLLLDASPKEAMALIDRIRLEAPGTLLEEAAVRRGIAVAGLLGDAARFEFLATRYAIRFPRSMYARAFRERFAESYLALASDPAAPPRLEPILEPLAPDDRRDIYLEIARRALVRAQMGLAGAAAEKAAALASPNSVEMQRAGLYRAAASAFGDDPATARAELEISGSDDLSESDRELLRAVRSVVAEVQSMPVAGRQAPPAAAAPDDQAAAAISRAKEHAAQAMAAAEQTLALAER